VHLFGTITCTILICALLAVNVLAFALIGMDKGRAKRKAFRISERTLLLVSACFGSLGGMAGMLVFRHKTRHAKFALSLPIMLVAHIALSLWLLPL
jgi:uncharacterized membrane protein YsdA (DUF1294 family)